MICGEDPLRRRPGKSTGLGEIDRRGGVSGWRKIWANGLPDTGKPKNQALGWLRSKLCSLDGGTRV